MVQKLFYTKPSLVSIKLNLTRTVLNGSASAPKIYEDDSTDLDAAF